MIGLQLTGVIGQGHVRSLSSAICQCDYVTIMQQVFFARLQLLESGVGRVAKRRTTNSMQILNIAILTTPNQSSMMPTDVILRVIDRNFRRIEEPFSSTLITALM